MTSITVTSQPGREVHSHHHLSCGSLCLHKQICIMPTSLLTLLIVKTKNLIKSHRGSAGKESACNVGDLCSIPGLGRSWRRERLPTALFWHRRIPWMSIGLQRVRHNRATFTHSREIKDALQKRTQVEGRVVTVNLLLFLRDLQQYTMSQILCTFVPFSFPPNSLSGDSIKIIPWLWLAPATSYLRSSFHFELLW